VPLNGDAMAIARKQKSRKSRHRVARRARGITAFADASVAAVVSQSGIDALMSTERACVWTLGGLLDDAQFERLMTELATCSSRSSIPKAPSHSRCRHC
jgi:hypothetical protein